MYFIAFIPLLVLYEFEFKLSARKLPALLSGLYQLISGANSTIAVWSWNADPSVAALRYKLAYDVKRKKMLENVLDCA